MKLSEFSLQPRGPRRFDTWLWDQSVDTDLGRLPVELYCKMDASPNEAMVQRASELAAFARANGPFLLDLVHAHYRFAQANDFLDYWDVPYDLDRGQVLGQVDSVTLTVHQDLSAGVFVDPLWDPEHKLSLEYDGTITTINDAPFRIEDGALVLL